MNAPESNAPAQLIYAIGGDHAGFPLKKLIAESLTQQGFELIDCGTHDETRCDYPKFALAVAKAVASGRAQRGILVCGSGVGVSVTANKLPGIRAALCHDTYSAHQGVEHDNMNILCLGARIIGSELAMECVRSFMAAQYTNAPRHAHRLAQLEAIEEVFVRPLT